MALSATVSALSGIDTLAPFVEVNLLAEFLAPQFALVLEL
jgi:hypothetical protein